MNDIDPNNAITNDSAPNNERPKMSLEDMMWEARRQNDRKLYAILRHKLGLGKHWLQKSFVPLSKRWGAAAKRSVN
jgi:hypothetical protein